MVFKIKQL